MNALILTVVIALGGLPRPAAPTPAASAPLARSPAELREQVETFLATIDTPISAQQWQGLGPDAAPLLISVASDHSAMPTRRARAVEALGMRRDAAAAKVVRELAAGSAEPKIVRVTATRAVPKVSLEAEAQAALAPLLQDPELQVRASAAGALATLGAPGCKLVAQRLPRESGEARALLERSSAACRKP